MHWAEDQSSPSAGTSRLFFDHRTSWSIPWLRTDSVNRGFCISLFTLAIVVLAVFIGFFFFCIVRIE
jgi:hypothetical protein